MEITIIIGELLQPPEIRDMKMKTIAIIEKESHLIEISEIISE